MNILVAVHDMVVPNRGGGAPRTCAVAGALKKSGHSVFLFAPIGVPLNGAEKKLGCRIINTWHINRNDPKKIVKYGIYQLALFLKTLYAIKKHRIDVVFAHDFIYGFPAFIASRICRVPFVFDISDLVAEYVRITGFNGSAFRILDYLEGYLLRHSSKVITVSRAMKEILEKRGARNVSVVYDGVDLKAFYPCRPKYKKKGKFVLVYEGGMDPQDGLDILVPAAKELIKKIPNAQFWLIGDGKAVTKMKEEIKKEGLGKHFMFTGWIPYESVKQYISDSDAGLVIMPDILSARIRVTLKVFEYWACRKPVIAAKLDALEEVVGRDTGIFYAAGNAGSLMQSILSMYNDRRNMRRLAANGYRRSKDFDWEKLGADIARIVNSAAEKQL